jgi:TonB family protein
MKKLQDKREKPDPLKDSTPSDTGRLLKSGFFSILLHIALVIFLILNLWSAIPKGEPTVYRVTIRPESTIPLTLLGETQIQKEENKSIPEGRKTRPVVNKKNHEQVIPLPKQPVIISVPQEEQKQVQQHEKEEEKIIEPIPLPMAELSPLSTDLDEKTEDNPSILLRSSGSGEQSMNTLSNPGFKEGQGIGPGGSGEGTGLGQGGPGSRVGYGSGPGQGGSGMGGSGEGEEGVGGLYPRYGKNPKPVYPQEAREKGYQGEVLLKVEVLSNGRVGQVDVKKSSGYDILDQCALTTVKEWRFIPARKGEVAISVWVNIPIKFQLL